MKLSDKNMLKIFEKTNKALDKIKLPNDKTRTYWIHPRALYDFLKAMKKKIPKKVYEREIAFMQDDINKIRNNWFYKLGVFLRIIKL